MLQRIVIWTVMLLLLVTGCAPKFGENTPNADRKTFEYEDQYIINALISNRMGDYNQSAQIYQKLYDESHKPEYLYEKFKCLFTLKAYSTLEKEVLAYLDESPKHPELLRFLIAVLNEQEKHKEAKEAAFTLLESTKSEKAYNLIASLYITEEKYESAVKYLESGYAKAYNEEILLQLSALLYYKLGRKKEAIAQLESHSRIHSCSEKVCGRLASFYADMDDTNGQISTYKRLYKRTGNAIYAQSVIKAYAYNRENYKLVMFLEESGFDDELLLRLYFNQKQYDKSIGLSSKLYEQTKRPIFKAQYAISLYEGAKEHTKDLLTKVLHELKEAVDAEPDAVYLNYLGYLMIEHDVNIEEGIKYVNKALAMDENSGFYLDSLAWGYYKQGRCKEAMQMIEKAKDALGKSDPEIDKHMQKIKHCNKE